MLFNRHPMTACGRPRNGLDDLWNDLLLGGDRRTPQHFRAFPQFNIWEEQDALHMEAELPGIELDDIEILVEGKDLTLRGGHEAQEEGERRYIRKERNRARFSRTVKLPYEVNVNEVEATLNLGVLDIVLPKAESMKPRKITVVAKP